MVFAVLEWGLHDNDLIKESGNTSNCLSGKQLHLKIIRMLPVWAVFRGLDASHFPKVAY